MKRWLMELLNLLKAKGIKLKAVVMLFHRVYINIFYILKKLCALCIKLKAKKYFSTFKLKIYLN